MHEEIIYEGNHYISSGDDAACECMGAAACDRVSSTHFHDTGSTLHFVESTNLCGN